MFLSHTPLLNDIPDGKGNQTARLVKLVKCRKLSEKNNFPVCAQFSLNYAWVGVEKLYKQNIVFKSPERVGIVKRPVFCSSDPSSIQPHSIVLRSYIIYLVALNKWWCRRLSTTCVRVISLNWDQPLARPPPTGSRFYFREIRAAITVSNKSANTLADPNLVWRRAKNERKYSAFLIPISSNSFSETLLNIRVL